MRLWEKVGSRKRVGRMWKEVGTSGKPVGRSKMPVGRSGKKWDGFG